MKHTVITTVTAITAAALAAGAATLEVPRLPEPATADREVSATHAVPAASSNGTQRLTALIRVTASGVCLAPAFADRDGAVAFAGLPQPPLPEWLRPGTWDTLRVTARGAGAPQERIKTVFAPDGARITIK